MLTRLRSQWRLSALSGLQIFQFTRYAGFVLIGMCFAKLGISRTEIGRFESFLWLMGLFSFFWIAGLMNSMLAIYPRRTEAEKKQLFFTAFCLIFLLSSVAGLVQLLVPGGSALGLAYLLLNNVSYIIEYILFLNGSKRKLIIYGIAMAVVQLLLCVAPAYIYGDTHYSVYGLLAVAGIKFIYIVYLLQGRFTSKSSEGDFNSQPGTLKEGFESVKFPIGDLGLKVKGLFLLSLPLMLGLFVNGSAEYIDGAVVRHYFTLADFSVFRYGSKEFPLFTILAATLSMSMIPRVAEDLALGLDNIRRESLRYMHFFFPLAIALIISGQWLFTTFFSPQFAVSGRVFAALMLLTAPRLLFPQTVLTALKENRMILICAIAEMIINIVASVILARSYGLVGVAYGTIIAFTAEKLLMAAILYYRHGIPAYRYVSPMPFAVYTALTLSAYVFSLIW
jgi:O-antigen/teichoic acid export membrane protein